MLRDICPLFTGNTFAIYMLLVVSYHVSFLLHGVQEKDWGIQGVRISKNANSDGYGIGWISG